MTGITNDQAGLQSAISQVHTALSAGVDVGDRVVPIKSVTARRTGPTQALCTATFNYTFLNTPSSPSDTEFTDIEYQVTSVRVPVYRGLSDADGAIALADQYDADGLPTGSIIGCTDYLIADDTTVYADGTPIFYQFEKSAVRIVIYGESASAPSIDYVNAARHLNGANTTIAGITFAAGQLRLDGLSCRRVVKFAADGTTSYKYVYAATYTAAKNFKQHVLRDGGPRVDTDGDERDHSYTTLNESAHPTYLNGSGIGIALPVPTTA